MIAICPKCGARNRLPSAGTRKKYRCHKCKAPLADSPKDTTVRPGTQARSSNPRERTSINPPSVSFVLLVLMIAGAIGVIAWQIADKASVGSKESLAIVMYPDERLREIAKPVDKAELGTERITRLVELMTNTLVKSDAAGLAAPQVGILERIILVRTRTGTSLGDTEVMAMVNPEIIDSEGSSTAIEGCLSIPRGDWKIDMTRSETVTVRYLTPDGVEQTLAAAGGVAREVQHEIDHLNGVLVVDSTKRHHLNSKLAIAVGIYLLVLTIAVGLYARNRVRERKRRP